MLVVSCPCALSLATPAALTAATGALVGRGLLIDPGARARRAGKATHVVFDKTGTLTEGRSACCARCRWPAALDACLGARRGALEGRSSHPIAAAFARDRPVRRCAPVSSARVAVAGTGIEAVVDGLTVRLGVPEWAAELVPGAAAIPPADGATWVLLAAADGRDAGSSSTTSSAPRRRPPSPPSARSGSRYRSLSGDAAPAVERLAERLGVATAVSRATPEAKLAHVRAIQAAGGVVLMIGDGVNDAPGLGGAEVAIAMGGGTDLVRTRADAVLLREDLRALPAAVRLARRTLRVIGENLAWAVAYNGLAVPLAALGIVPPYWAAIGMSASSLVVVANAWKLGRAAREVAA